ncbi:MAG: hypothetical protein ACKV0T_14710 [Planctomycetales bacterium]
MRLSLLKLGATTTPPRRGRVARVARLLALTHQFATLIRNGDVRDLARLGQIMDLLLLAPAIQEATLFLLAVETGDDPIHEWQLRQIVAFRDWGKQRKVWRSRRSVGD